MKDLKYILVFILIFITACGVSTEEEGDTPPSISVVEETVVPETKDIAPIKTPEQKYNEYTIDVDINPETNIVKGVVRLKYHNKTGDKLDNLVFNLYLNAFSNNIEYQAYFNEFRDRIFGENRDYGYMNINSVYVDDEEVRYTVENTHLDIKLNDLLLPEKEGIITIQFDSYIPKIKHRTGANKNAIWLGNFFPIIAVYENGNFRKDLYYKAGSPFYSNIANYTVNIKMPNNDYKIVAPGKGSIKEGEEGVVYSFTANMIRSFPCVVMDRSYIFTNKSTNNDVDINIYYNSYINNINEIMTTAIEAMEFFNEYIGPYPYEKFDIVEVDTFIDSGIEYPQMTMMNGNYMNSPSALESIKYDIGHQWFYNIVGSNRIDSPWQDEGLIGFIVDKYTFDDSHELKKHYEELYEGFSKSPYINYLLSDGLYDYKSWEDYENVQKTKGKLMVYSLSYKLGEEKFKEFVRLYYSRYSFSIAKTTDFISVAEEVYGDTLEVFFNDWLYEEKLPPLYYD